MSNSYSRLANLPDEDEKPKNSYSRLASLKEDDEASEPVAETPADSDDFHTEDESRGDWWRKELNALASPKAWARQAKLAGRAAIEGIEALPMTAMDMGVSARNMLTGSNYQMPSEMNRESLNTALPEAETKQEKIAGFLESAVAGSRIPAPQAAKQAPTGFIKPSDNPIAPILKEAQDAGYVVPPATASASKGAKLAESLAGKISVAQAASVKNQQVTNELARKALGMAGDQPITPKALKDIRETAGKVYEEIGNTGDIHADEQFLTDLAQLGRGADEVAQAFPGANVGATKQVNEMVSSLLQDKFSSKAALQYLRELRKMSSGNMSGLNAADPAKQALGMAQREAAATLEDLIGRHLERNGFGELADSFSTARTLIAKTHTVENALNETTGNVIAGKLGQQLAKKKPLSGGLETAARFARAFPKAAKEVTESMPGASPLDWAASGIISGASGNPAAIILAGLRPTVRQFLMSSPGQKMFTESMGVPTKAAPSTLGLKPSLLMNALPNQQSEEEQ